MSDEVLTRLIDERNAEIARLRAENAKLVTVLNGYHLLIDENARLTAALHKLEAHPDYEYDRGRENWERNPEAGDECWRRRRT